MKGKRPRNLVRVAVSVVAILILGALLSACQQAAPAAKEQPAAKPAEAKPAAEKPAAAKPAAETTTPIKIRIARTQGPASAGVMVADGEGLFKKYGLDATVRGFPSNGDAVNAMLAGDVDASHPAGQLVNSIIDRGADITIVSVASRSPRDMKVLTRSDIQSPQDLKGKKLVATKGTTSEFLMARYLNKNGLKSSDVQWIYADPPEIVAVMDRGEAVGFSLWEPYPARAKEVMGDKVKIVAISEGLDYKGSLYQIVNKKFAAENGEAITRMLKAMNEANQIIKNEPERAAKHLVEITKLPLAEAVQMLKNAEFDVVLDNAAVPELLMMAEWMKESERVKAVPDFNKYVDSKFLKSVDAKLVTQ